MLQLAIKAQIPVIAAFTRDTMNLPDVLTELLGMPIIKWDGVIPTGTKPGTVFLWVMGDEKVKIDFISVYKAMVDRETSLLVVNPAKVVEPMFNVGEVPVPKSMVVKFLKEVTKDEKKAEVLAGSLGGCTIKEAAEFGRLTMARDKSLTAVGLMDTRKSCFQEGQGLTQVDTRQKFYSPPHFLQDWATDEKRFFLECNDPRLIPRGLLFDGPPGVGKTAGAKWLAEQWGVPLYRVDLGGTKNKYVGQSEQNLLNNLSKLDHEAPAMALFDEVEKVLAANHSDTSGVTSSMLSQILWWLAERKTRVFVVMTTNNAKALPKELYREGRINKSFWFEGILKDDVFDFLSSVVDSFGPGTWEQLLKADIGMPKQIHSALAPLYAKQERVPQAMLTDYAYNLVKGSYFKN